MSVYSNALGKGQEKDIGAFAQAIRRLSTAHKRANNRSEAAGLQLKWANETHTAQLAKYQADIDLTNKRNVALTDELKRREEASQRIDTEIKQKDATSKTVSTNVGSMIKQWAKYKQEGDASAKDKFYDAYANIMSADPQQAVEMKRMFEGLISAETGLAAEKTDIGRTLSMTRQTDALTQESAARTQGQLIDNKLKMRSLLQDDATIEKYNKFKSQVKSSAYDEMGISQRKPAIEENRRIAMQDFDGKIKVQLQKLSLEKDKMRANMDEASNAKLAQLLNGDLSALTAIDTSSMDREGSAAIQEMANLYKSKTAAEQDFGAQMREQDDFDYMVNEASEYAYGTMGMRGPGASFEVADMLTATLPQLKKMRQEGANRFAELRGMSSEDTTDDTINKQITYELLNKWQAKVPPSMWGFAKNLYTKGFENDVNSKRNAMDIFDISPNEKR